MEASPCLWAQTDTVKQFCGIQAHQKHPLQAKQRDLKRERRRLQLVVSSLQRELTLALQREVQSEVGID